MTYDNIRALEHLLQMLAQLQDMPYPRTETFAVTLRAIMKLISPKFGETYEQHSVEFLRAEGRVVAYLARIAINNAYEAAAASIDNAA